MLTLLRHPQVIPTLCKIAMAFDLGGTDGQALHKPWKNGFDSLKEGLEVSAPDKEAQILLEGNKVIMHMYV